MRAAVTAMLAAALAAGCRGDALLSFLPACPADSSLLFSTPPVAESDFTGLTPLGRVNPPGQVFPTGHISFFVPRDEDGANRAVPVVAPGAITIWQVESSERLGASPPQRDYRLRFAPCANVSAYVDHLQTLDPALAARLGPLDDAACDTILVDETSYRTCGKSVRVDLLAGEALGTAGGVERPALDFGLGDSRLPPLPYVDKTRDDFDPLHAACPADYFEGATGDALRGRFSDATGTVHRTVEPLCGAIAQDRLGTVQGRWFVSGTARSTPEDPHLALVHDHVNPTVPLFSVGTSLPGFTGVWTFTPAASGTVNRDFGDVGFGAVHCWNVTAWPAVAGSPAWMVVAYMPAAFRLLIEARSGARCEDGQPTLDDAAIAFDR